MIVLFSSAFSVGWEPGLCGLVPPGSFIFHLHFFHVIQLIPSTVISPLCQLPQQRVFVLRPDAPFHIHYRVVRG